MASSLPSLEVFGSPEKPGSSVIHLCMSVKRTVSGSVSGYLSVSAIAMSSVLSQSKVAGMSVIQLLRVVFVPFRNFHDDIGGAVRNCLAAKALLRRDSRRFVNFIEL